MRVLACGGARANNTHKNAYAATEALGMIMSRRVYFATSKAKGGPAVTEQRHRITSDSCIHARLKESTSQENPRGDHFHKTNARRWVERSRPPVVSKRTQSPFEIVLRFMTRPVAEPSCWVTRCPQSLAFPIQSNPRPPSLCICHGRAFPIRH